MQLSRGRTLFRIWSTLAAPLLAGAFWISFQANVWFGSAFLLLFALWLYDMGATTCSRCSNYGTSNCGIQALLVPLFYRRRSVASVSRTRVRLHVAFDILMLAAGIAIYARVWWLAPIMILWTIMGVLIVYAPGRHHGLLHVLRKSRRTGDDVQPVALEIAPSLKQSRDSP